MNKRDELHIYVAELKPDIIAITESWTHSEISDNEIEIPGYKLFRQDRTDTHKGRGGGVLLYVICSLTSSQMECTVQFTNSLWCDISTQGGVTRVGVVYRSPNSTAENDDKLYEALDELNSVPSLVIIGDFNYPGINWSEHTADPDSQRLLDWVLDKGFTQHIDYPTRERNTLDLILTSEPDMLDESEIFGRLGDSDHDMILASLVMSTAKKTTY